MTTTRKKKKTAKAKDPEKPKRVIPPGASPRSGYPPPVHSRWKPGQSGFTGCKISPEMRQLRRLTKDELVEVGNVIVKGDMHALKRMYKDESESVLKVMIVAIAIRIIKKGDMGALNLLLDRLVGKVGEDVSLVANVSSDARHTVIVLPSNGREVKVLDAAG